MMLMETSFVQDHAEIRTKAKHHFLPLMIQEGGVVKQHIQLNYQMLHFGMNAVLNRDLHNDLVSS